MSSNPFDPNRVSNPYGDCSPYKPDSVTNHYQRHGSPYSPTSVPNPYATDMPVLVDPDTGKYLCQIPLIPLH